MGYLPGNISYACLDLQTFELSKIGLIWAVTNVLVYWAVIILPSEILRSHEFRIQSSTHYFIDSRHFRWTVWFADCFSAFSGGKNRHEHLATRMAARFCGAWYWSEYHLRWTLLWGKNGWKGTHRCEVFSWRLPTKLEEGIWLRNDVIGANLEGKNLRSYKIKFTEVQQWILSITSSSYDSVVCDASTSSPKSGVGLGVETRVGDRIHEYTDVYSILSIRCRV